jgi:PAS domain S-box-containing protein
MAQDGLPHMPDCGDHIRMQSMIHASRDAMFSTSADGFVTSWNPAAEALLGYREDEMRGKLTTPLTVASVPGLIGDLLRSGDGGVMDNPVDTVFRHRNGEDIPVEISISPVTDDGGDPLGHCWIVRGTERRENLISALRRLQANERRFVRQQAATSAVQQVLMTGSSLEQMLELICARATELFEASVAVIAKRDGDSVRIVGATGVASEMLGMTLPSASSFAEEVLQSAQPRRMPSRTSGSKVEVPSAMPDGPTMGVPVMGEDGSIAVLTFIRDEGREPFAVIDVTVAETFAAQASLAFEIDERRRDRQNVMLLGDRERIARDLHDLVIQEVFATGMQLQSVLGLIDRQDVRVRVSDAVRALDNTIGEIRNAIHSLTSSALEQHPLRAQIANVVKMAETNLDFSPHLQFEGATDIGMTETVARDALAVVREGLSNIARHSRATEVWVKVTRSADLLHIVITDNGVGIVERSRASGLANLEERALLHHGTFEISTPEKGGTRIDWQIPL